MGKPRPRDERGWAVPRDGTLARELYERLASGESTKEVMAWYPAARRRSIKTMMIYIKNPEKQHRSYKPKKRDFKRKQD